MPLQNFGVVHSYPGDSPSLADVEADLALYGITGLTKIADTLVLDAVRDLAKELGK